jgi:hypothetical protein
MSFLSQLQDHGSLCTKQPPVLPGLLPDVEPTLHGPQGSVDPSSDSKASPTGSLRKLWAVVGS